MGVAPAELLSPPAVTWGSFQMPALTLVVEEGQEHLRLLDDGQGPCAAGGGKGWKALINKEPRAQDAVKAVEKRGPTIRF